MRVLVEATARRMTALIVTQSFDATLLWAAQARSSMRETAAASAPRVTALLVTQAFERAALGSAAHLSMRAVAGRMPRDSLARHSLGDSALL